MTATEPTREAVSGVDSVGGVTDQDYGLGELG